jgi:hypothetical protein
MNLIVSQLVNVHKRTPAVIILSQMRNGQFINSVKLVVCLKQHIMKIVRRHGNKALSILNLQTTFFISALDGVQCLRNTLATTFQRTKPHWVGGWVRTRARLNVMPWRK